MFISLNVIFVAMRILALSDVHGDRAFIRRMAEKAVSEKVDLVILAGDIADEEHNVDGMVGPFKAKGLEVAVLPGNHEGMGEVGFLIDKYHAMNLHGYAKRFGDVGIFGCGYGDIGVHQLTEEQFFDTLKQARAQLSGVKKTLMVTHVQPSESILGLGMFPGSSGVRKAIMELKPNVHVCGHIHETQGIEDIIGKTRVVNVGKKGVIIDL